MGTPRTHFRPTTAAQRRLLFETWHATGNVTLACRTAHVGRRTFYYWKPRFDRAGYVGLDQVTSSAPKQPARTPSAIAQQVITLRQTNPTWGKQRIAHELAKAHAWRSVVSANTVKRILRDAHLWPGAPPTKKKGFVTVSRTSDTPGQTVNVDVCFVPAQHALDQKLPAVSGSSGRLVVERARAPARQSWPGEVFTNPHCAYEDAMHAFVTAANTRYAWRNRTPSIDASPTRAQPRELRQQAAALQTQRRSVREQRRQEDAAWQALRAERRQTQEVMRRHGLPEYATYLAQEAQWRALRQQRQATLAQRQQEDLVWRQDRLHLRQALANATVVTTWRAILLVTDNCTRACYGLPLFANGAQVSSEQVIAAVTNLLPPDLQFLISDRGTHVTAHTFAQCAEDQGFGHVQISRRRPQTNGIAERCVRTLKEWLRQHVWTSNEELAALLAQFVTDYNERPHQGLGIPGLSPNEFTKRVWLF